MGEIYELLRKQGGFSSQEALKTEERWQTWLLSHLKKKPIKEIHKHFEAITDVDVDQLVIVDNIEVDGCCPHHLLPITMRVHIGYLPDGQVLGLSKFARIASDLDTIQLQESYTQALVDTIGVYLKPQWAMAIVVGTHTCMSCRGVTQRRSETVTSAIYNIERDPEGDIKKEFMDFITHNLRK